MPSRNIASVEIAICTWNRHQLLTRTLDSVAELQVPAGIEVGLILIDNESTDSTPEVIETFARSAFASQHRLVTEVESKRGHTHARNRALDRSRADLILWTDDDVRLPRDWVTRYLAGTATHPQCDFWGGPIEPEFPAGRPDWITANWDVVKGCFATRDLGPVSIPLTPDRLPYGANFAVRGSVQREHRFDVRLGRCGESVAGEDELELMRRLINAGCSGRWLPGAPVRHQIPPDRATPAYVYQYFVGQGRSLVAHQTGWTTDVSSLRSESRREYLAYWCKSWWAAPTTWCSHLIRSGLAHGQFLALSGS